VHPQNVLSSATFSRGTASKRMVVGSAMGRSIWLRRLCVIAIASLILAFCAGAQDSAQSAMSTADKVIDRYIAAIGGSAAMEKLTSRVSMGTIEIPAMHLSGTVMIHEKAPNKILQVVIINGNAFQQAFDGTNAWTDDPADGTRFLSGIELSEARRDADFSHALHLHEIYPKITFVGTEKIGGHDAYLLQGTAADEADPDKMYFDTQSGLALRVVSHRHTPDGDANVQEDFQDYRKVDGLELPFTILQTGGSSDFTIRISELHHGVELEDSEFVQPKPGRTKVQ
jgi:outer membrane lipoprotein-sorting protein